MFFTNKSLTYIRKTHTRDFRYENFKRSFIRLSSQKVINCLLYGLIVVGLGWWVWEGGGGHDRQLLLFLRTVAAGLSKSFLSFSASPSTLSTGCKHFSF